MSRATTIFQDAKIGTQHIGDNYINFMSDVQSQKVPYHILEINQDLNSTFEEVTTLLNLQINIQFRDTKYGVPFIEPLNFQELGKIDKLLLKGLKGVGKTRCALELLKEYINTNRNLARKILIINPVLDNPDESTINELKDKISKNDIILWPDFPRGLPFKDNPVYGLQTLGLLMTLTHRIHLTLDHEYLKSYDKMLNSIIEPKVRNVAFDESAFAKIIDSYGNIQLFQEIFSRFIINRIDEVSKILFEKEPTPALVEVFYREALEKKSSGILNPVLIARNIKGGIDYYKDSFQFIVNNNPNEAHFLYILKLSYDLGLPRTRKNLKDLQTAIFGNSSTFLDSPSVNLSTLVTSTKDGQFSMHDNLKNAISYPEEWSGDILQYFFSKDYLDETNENFSQQILFGTFLGRNIHLISSHDTILPDHVRIFMADHPVFLSGFSAGLGSIFETIDDTHKRKIWKMVEENNFLQFSLFLSFGLRYLSLDRDTKEKIWRMVEHDIECKIGIGMSIGSLFPSLDKETRDKIWRMVDEDVEFGMRALVAITSIMPTLDKDTRDRIWKMVENDHISSFFIGMSLGGNFPFFDDNTKQHILANLHKNDSYCCGFYEGIGINYMKLDAEFQNQLISNNPTNEKFETYELLFGIGLGFYFTYSNYDSQTQILDLVDQHKIIRIGLAAPIGFKFESYDDDIKQRILSICEEDHEFEYGLFQSFGIGFHTFKPATQDLVLSRIKDNEDLAKSFGSFLGRNLLFVDYNIDKIMKWTDDYKGLVDEFGIGISSIYPSLHEANKQRIWELVEKNDNFKASLLYGLGLNLISYLNYKEILEEIVGKIESIPEQIQDFFDGVFELLSIFNLNQIHKLVDLLESTTTPYFSALFFLAFLSFIDKFSKDLYLDELSPEKFENYNILVQDERFQNILCKSLMDYLHEMDDSFLRGLSLLLDNYENLEVKFKKYVNQISIDSKNIEKLTGKGFFLYSRQKYEEAISTFDQVLSIESSPDLYILKGSCFSFLNKPKDAVNAYNEALNLDSNNIEALDPLGQIYNDVLFDYQKAYEIGKKLKELRGSSIDKFVVIEGLIEIKEFDEALNEAQKTFSSSTSPTEKSLANLFSACASYLQSEPLKGVKYATESLNFLTEKTGSRDKDIQLAWNFDGLKYFLNHTDINPEERKLIFNLFSFFKYKVELDTVAPSSN